MVRKRIALGVSIPVVILFIGVLTALLVPSNLLTLTEALDQLGLLGSRQRIAGLIAAPPGPDAAPPLIILNGRIWDAASGLRPNQRLCLAGGRILAATAPEPQGARVIDAIGLTILPGLIDMHVHSFGGTFADEMMIGSGVTSARDLGTQLAGVLRHKQEAERGARIAPRLFVTGPYLVSGAGTSDQEIGIASPEAAASVVARFADAGVDGIKVHAGIEAPTLRAVVAAAHARGLWVAAHLDRVSAVEAAEIGVDTIEHASGVDLDAAAENDGDEEAAIVAMVSHRVALTPTLVVAEHAFTVAEPDRDRRPELFVPRFMRRFWISSQVANAGAGNLTSAEVARRRAHLERLMRFVERFHRAGGRVLAGTDAPAFLVAPGFDMHRELELLAQAGLSRTDALAAATSEAAVALGRAKDLGGLSAGMRADLVVVSSLENTRDLFLVVKDGRVLVDRLGN